MSEAANASRSATSGVGEVLAGGNMGEVLRIGDTVRRPAGEWTPAVQRLLALLRESGVVGIPEPLGLDERGREMLSFVEGENLAAADPELLWSERVLVDAGRLLKRIHDASVPLTGADLVWRTAAREPVEVVCHNDFATYNLIVRDDELVGAIDFDLASPGPRIWDLAYLAYRIVPYAADAPDTDGLDRAARLRSLLDAYGTDASPRQVLAVAAERLDELEAFTRDRAAETGRADLLEHAAM
ncbi:phosphotransferase [Agromyces soli]|uniref:Aminoglycoside phosphotransferase family protein n=1 Tax=Agromyces soli TaxID=659012 RepID=A0ABY4AQP7_9MICO|nr:aminoglycoside phosphotransferase family protein [Agromyces soli]UOE25496.1 aminoglycoside phosphotransferase family protein [Agromyces soli]